MSRSNRIDDTKLKDSGNSFIYDKSFEGPIKKRFCTDILFLLVFIAFIIGWTIIGVLGYTTGNPERIIFPTDSYGNLCGRGKYEDRPFLLFFNLLKCAKNVDKNIFDRCDTPQVCVKECPNKTFSLYYLTQIDNKYLSQIRCKYGVNPNNYNIRSLIDEEKCAGIYFKSEPFGGRCIPSLLSIKGNDLIDEMNGNDFLYDQNSKPIELNKIKETNQVIVLLLNAKEIGIQIINDLNDTIDWILVGLALSMFISFSWIVCMQWFAKIMIWFSILAVIILNSFGVYYSVNRYNKLKSEEHHINTSITSYDFRKSMDSQLDSYLANRKTWLAFSIICSSILFILVTILLYLRKRIKLAIALIIEASRAVSCVKSSLFFPIIPYIFQLIIISLWGFVAILIIASARPKYRNKISGKECEPQLNSTLNMNTDSECIFVKYYSDNTILSAQLYNLFGLIWGLFFAAGVGQVSLAGAFASYYWVFDKPKSVPYFTVFGGFYRCIRYHIGSVAFGSLLIATVRFIRIILEYIDKKCKKYANNFISKAIMCCCKCLFWILESFLRFINKNAYIMIAIHGQGFCASASDGFCLVLRNATRAVVLDKLTDLLLIIGKLTVTSIVGVLSFYVFTNKIEFIPISTLNYSWVPIVFIILGTYLISSSFFSVYHMAVDTLFLCFLEDCERNDGSPEKPYYMSKNLMKVLRKSNKT